MHNKNIYDKLCIKIITYRDHMTSTPASIIRQARLFLKLNQKDFAEQLGKTQSVLSRYESGDVQVPSNIVMHCMHILNKDSTPNNSDSMKEIILKIRTLDGDQHRKLREALNIFLDKFLGST